MLKTSKYLCVPAGLRSLAGRDVAGAVVSGILMVLIFPAWDLHLVSWVCLVPLIACACAKSPRQGWWLGCIAGFVYHCGLVYWVTVSMTLYGGLPLVLSGLLMVLFALVLSVFVAAPLWLSCYVRQARGAAFLLTLPVFWTMTEHVRSWILSGFPWEHLGYSQYRCLPVIQIADITGVYGVSFLVLTVNCAVFAVLRGIRRPKTIPLAGVFAAAALAVAVLGYGHARLRALDLTGDTPLTIAVIQPNISQHLKWDPAYLEQTLAIFKTLTLGTAELQADMVLWPESATPFFFASEETYRRCVEEIVRATGTHLLLGSPSFERHPFKTRYFNSAYLISPDNRILGRYDKLHLVPFGEYVPLGRLLPFVNALVAGIGDFSPGSRVLNLPLPGCPLAPLICYEIIFPDLVRQFVKQGARAIVNITNDAWFGRTGAPYQHLSMTVLRAVENRRSIARCANTGISACIAPSGKILSQTKLFTRAVLPAMIYCRSEMTLYTRYGDVFAYICYALSLAFVLAAYRGAQRQPRGDQPAERAHNG